MRGARSIRLRSLAPYERRGNELHISRKFSAAITERLPLLARIWTAQVGGAGRFAAIVHARRAGDAFQLLRRAGGKASRICGYPRNPAGRSARAWTAGRRSPSLIAPWTAQLPILSYKLGAALAAGCTVVVKSSPEQAVGRTCARRMRA